MLLTVQQSISKYKAFDTARGITCFTSDLPNSFPEPSTAITEHIEISGGFRGDAGDAAASPSGRAMEQ
jgi:hypothetical protein